MNCFPIIPIHQNIPLIWRPKNKMVKKYGDYVLRLKCHSMQCVQALSRTEITKLDQKRFTQEYLDFLYRINPDLKINSET